LCGNFFQRQNVNEADDFVQKPCVIYMHGNAGNKMEGAEYVGMLAKAGIDLVTFDFSGCGNSEGQWCTLGHKE
jgi:alpha/beta superfamily hydrolase